MKKIYFVSTILFALLLVSSCTSSKKYFELQQYDNAIVKSIKVLNKKPEKSTEIDILNRAYALANRQDNERIQYLRTTGQPDIWSEIFKIYVRLKSRQDQVKVLPQSILTKINFTYVDYTQETVNAQQNAAEYYYQKGLSLLKAGDRFSAREAYEQFNLALGFFSNYKDCSKLINQAVVAGTTNVVFEVKNSSRKVLPEGFVDEIMKIQLTDLNRLFIKFYTYASNSQTFNYYIRLNINNIEVSPESVREIMYDEAKTIQDGWNYVLDQNGNVLKDSLGNDVKTPRMVDIVCKVREIQMHKQALVGATLDIYDSNGSLVKTDPVSAETYFDYSYGYANGDISILKPETRKIISRQRCEFPNDLQMIGDASDIVKNISKDIINTNSYVFK